MKLQLIFMVIILQMIYSCNNDSHSYNFHVTNKDLIEQIALYREKIEIDNKNRILRGDSVYVGVYAKNCNDSIKRYVLYPIVDCRFIEYDVPFLVCKIKSHSTFFSSVDFAPYHYGDTTFFNLPKTDQIIIMKDYFPNRYKEYRRKRSLSNCYIYEPENCYLTFLKDSLIDVTHKYGTHLDKIKICINGMELYL